MMASCKKGQREIEQENKELASELDPVTELVHLVVNTILHEEVMKLASEITK